MQSVDLSIIIVHFNTPELLNACLNSIYKAKKQSDVWEVIVVDNGSTDQSRKRLESLIKVDQYKSFLRVIFEKENHGFSGGNNIGIRNAKGKFILLLNSDTEIEANAIEQTCAVFSDPNVGAATCKLILPDGNIDPACHRGFPTPWAALTYFSGLEKIFPFVPLFSHYHQLYKNFSSTHEIDAPSGAFFMVRREVIEKVGLLDEDYFMYGEDIDWAYRIKQKGFKILFVPTGVVLHRKKQSGRESSDTVVKKKTNTSFYETMKLFYKKHYLNKYPKIITIGIIGVINLKMWLINTTTSSRPPAGG